MKSKEEAIGIARKYLIDNPLPSPIYIWILPEPVRTDSGWYFEYTYKCLEDIPPEHWDGFGGARGFIVSDNGTVRNI